MTSKERRVDACDRRSRSLLNTLREELRNARLDRGLSQREVAASAGIAQSELSRFERGERDDFSLPQIARLLAAVGLVFSARAFPDGSPIRDAAHRALLDRLRAIAPPTVRWRYEVPLPQPGDLRAWDATVQLEAAVVAVEAETGPRDVQALQRRLNLKLRDDERVEHVVLLLADTRRNRRLMREHGEALRTEWPIPRDQLLAAIRAGTDPGGSGVLLL